MTSNKKIVAIIPAAGKGTRLRPFSNYLPKEMMPLGDKPIIYYTMVEILSAGIENIILVSSQEKEAMVDYLLRHADLPINNINLKIVLQKDQKGLGHAVLMAKPMVGDARQLAVLAPDDVMVAKKSGQDLAIGQLLQKSQTDPNAMWVAVEKIKKEESKKYGVLKIKNSTADIYQADGLIEKPTIESAPSDIGIIARYVLPTDIFAVLKKTEAGSGGEIQLTDAMQHLLERHNFFGVATNLWRFDTGTIEGLFIANYFYRYQQFPPKK